MILGLPFGNKLSLDKSCKEYLYKRQPKKLALSIISGYLDLE